MDNNDFIREIKSLFDRFIAEFITINSEYEKSIGKDLKKMEKTWKFKDTAIEFDLRHKERD